LIFKGRKVVGGYAEGQALISLDSLSFYGGVNPETGLVTELEHAIKGESITGKVLFFPTGKGSTVGSYVIYRMKKLCTAPVAIINEETDAIIATGCVMSGIPLIDRLDGDPTSKIKTGVNVKVCADEGVIETTGG
jgi:predicted aconitase with swiveling domain